MTRRLLLGLGVACTLGMCWAADAVGWPLSLPLMVLAVTLGTAGIMREEP